MTSIPSPQTGWVFVTILPTITFFAGLFADWFKQRMTHGFEEKKLLSRVISDLLELRFTILMFRELRRLPNQLCSELPSTIKDQLPANFTNMLDLGKLLPVDDKLGERYRKAVDEIAAYRPLIAYRLRGKERYLDLRTLISNYAAQLPGSSANDPMDILDREILPAIEETAMEIAKCHGMKMRFSIKRALGKRDLGSDEFLPKVQPFLQEQFALLSKIAEAERLAKTTSPSSGTV